MKYNIFRTTCTEKYVQGDKKPCKNAILVADAEYPENNHWEIEINTMEDFLALREEVGESLILSSSRTENGFQPFIEICDYYRE